MIEAHSNELPCEIDYPKVRTLIDTLSKDLSIPYYIRYSCKKSEENLQKELDKAIEEITKKERQLNALVGIAKILLESNDSISQLTATSESCHVNHSEEKIDESQARDEEENKVPVFEGEKEKEKEKEGEKEKEIHIGVKSDDEVRLENDITQAKSSNSEVSTQTSENSEDNENCIPVKVGLDSEAEEEVDNLIVFLQVIVLLATMQENNFRPVKSCLDTWHESLFLGFLKRT